MKLKDRDPQELVDVAVVEAVLNGQVLERDRGQRVRVDAAVRVTSVDHPPFDERWWRSP
ncbi:hypothetical protein [Nonomuraea bangladeshensis]|uniref:hypothetical protein n=1 Tax=Nonomuraea bangladeshensis TaxID=404385 RepID=UPI003C2BBA86